MKKNKKKDSYCEKVFAHNIPHILLGRTEIEISVDGISAYTIQIPSEKLINPRLIFYWTEPGITE